ncbi:MAG: hypothetical protein GX922_03295 [Firmicutes bacterium]|jgi:mismatch-specific thymine-DNA glycosylase|nr:hypothetical protein [Bacillota bacterium]
MDYSKLIGNQQVLKSNGNVFVTLKDLLPENGPMKMLIVAKTPAPKSVDAGHYFQGKQGKMFWNMLKKYNLLTVPADQFEDDGLLNHGYGITDIVKLPHEYSQEPTREEYRVGAERIIALIQRLQPEIVMFVYKKVLDNIIGELGVSTITTYGFNVSLGSLFGSKVFVFPMPGTPCTKEQQIKAMNDLVSAIY